MEQPGYYAVIPATVRYADIPANAKLLYGEISALCNREGFCWASNEYFAKLYSVSERSITDWMKSLVGIDAIHLVMIGRNQRKVYLKSDRKKVPSVIEENFHSDRRKLLHNNTSNNTVTLRETRIETVNSSEEDTKTRAPAKYPHAFDVFLWFPDPQSSWKALKNVQEREYAEFLFDRGEESVRGIIKFCLKYEDMEYFPAWRSPSKLEKNWQGIQDFAKRNGL